jgi:hypothetical protein
MDAEQRVLCGLSALLRLRRQAAGPDGVDEAVDYAREVLGRLHEFDAGSVEDDFLIHVADAAVDNPSLDDNGPIAEGEAEFVKGIDVQRKCRFDLCAAVAQLLDGHRLEDHHLAMQVAENLKPLGLAFAFVLARHPARL